MKVQKAIKVLNNHLKGKADTNNTDLKYKLLDLVLIKSEDTGDWKIHPHIITTVDANCKDKLYYACTPIVSNYHEDVDCEVEWCSEKNVIPVTEFGETLYK